MTNEKQATRNPSVIEADLSQFTGTTQYYRHWLGLLYTDGIHHLVEQDGAYWLVDAIASWQGHVRRIEKEFQVWNLLVHADQSANLTARRDSGEPAIVHQKIEYTDFPLKNITLYVQNDVLMLPTEY